MNKESNIKKYSLRFLCIPFITLERRTDAISQISDISSHGESTEVTLPVQQSSQSCNDGFMFYCDSMFLHSCYGDLIKGPYEELHLVTGTSYDNMSILTTMLPVEYKYQSVGGVRADEESVRRQLKVLDMFSNRYFAYFHSHPGDGEEATHPSSIDLDLQKKYEKAKQYVIGGIFSRSGHIRFYSWKMPFSITVAGSCIMEIEKNVFKLEV